MRLYGSLTSPYVRKVRILLKEQRIPCEFVVTDAWAADSPVPKLNPIGKVPVLALDDGRVLFDSPLICEYLDSLAPEPLIPATGETRWQALSWHALSQGILDAVVARLLESRRAPEKQSSEVIARQEEKIARSLTYADSAEKGYPYLLEERFSYADLTLAVALEYIDFRYEHPWREKHPRLALWLAGIMTRPSFAETEPPGVERAVDSPH
jgi:glutathione S-transferase